MFTTTNKKIAVTPFPTTETKTEVKGGLVVIKQRQELTKLTAVFPAHYTADGTPIGVPAGTGVYVMGDICKHPLAKQIYELDGKSFILIDASMVVGYEP
jgi:hypothetical protein